MQGRKLSEMEFTDPVSLENELAAMASIESACEDVSGRGGGEGGKGAWSSERCFSFVCDRADVISSLSFPPPPTLPPPLPSLPQALASYSTKEEDDARLINDGKLFNMFPKTQRMAIKHRRSEKRLLKKTAAAVKQQLLNLRSGKRKLRPEEEE
jgi:hypothetical protein